MFRPFRHKSCCILLNLVETQRQINHTRNNRVDKIGHGQQLSIPHIQFSKNRLENLCSFYEQQLRISLMAE